jgi:hypothetical protein
MKESIKMEDYNGYRWKFTKQEKTKILPLRWFGNLCEKPAAYNLGMAIHYSDHDDHGLAFKYYAISSNILYKPYFWWGTQYKMEIDKTENL